MDEGRKRALLIAASILAARKLAQYEYKFCPATVSAVANGVKWADEIMKEIERQWPRPSPQHDT